MFFTTYVCYMLYVAAFIGVEPVVKCIECFTELLTTSTDMRLLSNLLFFAHQLSLTSGMRVIDNGLGLPVYDFESDESMVDYALLSADHKASLPSQVQAILAICHF